MHYYPTEESNQQVQTPTEKGGESLQAVVTKPFEGSDGSSTLAGHIDLVLKSRRLDSHQHDSVYKTDAFLSRATSAEAVIAAAQA